MLYLIVDSLVRIPLKSMSCSVCFTVFISSIPELYLRRQYTPSFISFVGLWPPPQQLIKFPLRLNDGVFQIFGADTLEHGFARLLF